MSRIVRSRASVAVARQAVVELSARLGLPVLAESLPGADLLARAATGLPWPQPGVLLRTGDGWVHPGPPDLWDDFTAMAVSLGAPSTDPASPPGVPLPDLSELAAEDVDAAAALWRLPAVAVRAVPPRPITLPEAAPAGARPLAGLHAVVLGFMWATPLAGRVLASLGARVTRVEHPRRRDPFPLRDVLAAGQERLAIDLDAPRGVERLRSLFGGADLLLDGFTPRVLANLGLDPATLAGEWPGLAVVSHTAFRDEDRPGYGLAAEARGGWASHVDPPRLGRASVADPVSGLCTALVAADLVVHSPRPARARLGLDGGVAFLHEVADAVPGR